MTASPDYVKHGSVGLTSPLPGLTIRHDKRQHFPDPWDVLSASAPYLTRVSDLAEFIKFEYRFSAMVWLHRALANDISGETHALKALRESGQHRVPGWEGESDVVLGETAGLLEDAKRSVRA